MALRIPQAKPLLGVEEQKAVRDVLDSGMLASGERVTEFERRFASYVGTRHAVATSNGTTSLQVVFQALNLPSSRGTVITTPFTFIATSNALRYNELRPKYGDIDPSSYNLAPASVKKLVDDGVGAVMPVHLYGLAAQLDELVEICEDHRIPLIEDACQAHGARIRGRHVGSVGQASCFSFYPTKNMTTGEGGMITTDDPEFADRCRLIVHQGQKARYEHVMLGSNYRMTEIAAAIGLVQLSRLDAFVARRREIAAFYDHELADVPDLMLPSAPAHYTHGYHQYTLRTENRSRLSQRMTEAGIGFGIYYPKLSFEYPHLSEFATPCPAANRATSEVLSLPLHPGLTQTELAEIVRILRG